MELAIGTKFTFKGKTYIVSEDDQAYTYCDLNQGNCLAAKHRDVIGSCSMISRKDQKNVVFKEIEDMEKEINIAEILANKPKWTPKPFDKVLGRDNDASEWTCDYFSHIGRYATFICVGGNSWNYCIPYNEETAKLIGTTKSLEGRRNG